jgi:hypothetical protein
VSSGLQQAAYTCAACGHEGCHGMWVVIDAADRPDLIEELRRGGLRSFDCDKCGRPVAATTSLLVDSRRANSPLLFAPDPKADAQRTQEQFFASVVKHHREPHKKKGNAKKEQWTIPDTLMIPYDLLRVAVDRDVELDIAARKAGKWIAASIVLERYGDWLGGVIREREDKRLKDAVTALTQNGHSPDGFKGVVLSHQILLTEDADRLLSSMQDVAEEEAEPERERLIALWRHFLRLCRRDGVEAGLASLNDA